MHSPEHRVQLALEILQVQFVQCRLGLGVSGRVAQLDWEAIMLSCWAIWKARNKFVFELKWPSAAHVRDEIHSSWAERNQAGERSWASGFLQGLGLGTDTNGGNRGSVG